MGRKPDQPILKGWRYVSMPSGRIRVEGKVIGFRVYAKKTDQTKHRDATKEFILALWASRDNES